MMLLLLAVLPNTSCSYHEIEERDCEIFTDSKTYIRFEPVGQGRCIKTRVCRTTTDNLNSYGVSCSIYDASSTYASSAYGSYFSNLKIDAVKGTCEYPWPGERYKVSFFAYAPYGNDALTVSDGYTSGRPVYTYIVPSDITKQADFITAEVTDISGAATSNPVSLKFNHHLSDLTFSVLNKGYEDITIHSISVYGVKYKGSYSDKWTLEDDVNSASSNPFTLNVTDSTIARQTTVDVSGTANHMMLLPQTVTKGTDFIVVNATINGETKDYTYTLPSDFAMEKGKAYRLKITIGNKYISVVTIGDVEDWEPECSIETTGEVDCWEPESSIATSGEVEDWEPEK